MPRPHEIEADRLWPIERPTGPRRPTSARGSEGVGTVLVTPMSRVRKAHKPIASMTTTKTARNTIDGQSNWPASGRWLIVQPYQVSFAMGARPGTGAE